MAHNVKCLVCNQIFDADKEEYVLEGRRYIHKKCNEEREKIEFYRNDIHVYMRHIFGEIYSKQKIDKQINELMTEGKSIEGIDKALKYWYSVRGEDPSKANGGIRIVSFIYKEALDYYEQQEQNKLRNQSLDLSFLTNRETEKVVISPKPVEKPKKIKLFELQ